MPEYSQEERERAADYFSGELMRTGNQMVLIKLACGDRIRLPLATLETVCALNRANEEQREARAELLMLANWVTEDGSHPRMSVSLLSKAQQIISRHQWAEATRNAPAEEEAHA